MQRHGIHTILPFTVLLAGAVMLVACSDAWEVNDNLPEVSVNMCLTKAQDRNADRPALQFWLESQLAELNASGSYPQPYISSVLTASDKAIDEYGLDGFKYNTAEEYPSGAQLLYAVGYSPASQLSPAIVSSQNDYRTIELAASSLGKTDVLATEAPVSGSSVNRIDDGTKELVFTHCQSRIIVYAALAEDMQSFVRNVRVKVSADQLLGSLVWNGANDKRRYEAAAATSGEYVSSPGETQTKQLKKLSQSDNVGSLIDTVYVMPGKTSLTFTVLADYSTDVEFISPAPRTATNCMVQFEDGSSGIRLEENDSYVLTLLFSEKSILFAGRRIPWGDGGSLVIPVYPKQ